MKKIKGKAKLSLASASLRKASLITKIIFILFTTANDSPNLVHRHLMTSSDLEERNRIENNTWLLVDMEFLFYRVKHSKRNSISTSSYLLYCLSDINTIALYWEEKPTSLMNENKRIDNSRITIVKCVGADS